jgi:hypothetical protein
MKLCTHSTTDVSTLKCWKGIKFKEQPRHLCACLNLHTDDVAAKLPLYSISTRERCRASADLQIEHITLKLYVLFLNVIQLN